jgi:hypothetical protein
MSTVRLYIKQRQGLIKEHVNRFRCSQLGRLKMIPSAYYCISYFFGKLHTFYSHMTLTLIYERNPHRIHETGLEGS